MKEMRTASTSIGTSSPTVGFDLQDQVIFGLWQAEHAMRLAIDSALADKELGDLQISLPQFGTLTWLEREPGLSTADLARYNRVSPQNMGMAVTRLISLGYIERTPPRRGRVAELRLSEAGREVLAEAAVRVERVQQQMLNGLTPEERELLPDILSRCRRALQPLGRRSRGFDAEMAAMDGNGDL